MQPIARGDNAMNELREYSAVAATYFQGLQERICKALEVFEPKQRFHFDFWEREDGGSISGGGGRSGVLKNGDIFEQAGVNFSEVHGTLPAEMVARLGGSPEPTPFRATGISLVIHPRSPLVPTTHANFRYLVVGERRWFGGGADLTPYYLNESDARHFHSEFKKGCDRHDPGYYPRFKKWCDEYFYLPHRGETRGVGGIFFDYLGRDNAEVLPATWSFIQDIGNQFVPAYAPLVEQHRYDLYTEQQREFQLYRRGRYVEFNLLYDRGTMFGLQTKGRTESILMSLPPLVRWEYDFKPEPGSAEELMLKTVKETRDWV
jgi:coproporphyrinogen III oxidase